MMVVRCDLEGCEEASGCYSLAVPNPDRGWCSECHQQIGSITITYHFCCIDHLARWILDNYSDEEETGDNPNKVAYVPSIFEELTDVHE